MFGKKQKAREDTLNHLEEILAGAPTTIQMNNKKFNLHDNALKTFTVDGIKQAYAYLYAATHLDDASNLEISVYNPTPSKPKKDFLFPADVCLMKESARLEALKCADFIDYCEYLVNNRNVTHIDGVVSINEADTMRMTVGIDHDETHKDAGINIEIRVMGANKTENRKKLAQLCERIEKYQAKCLENLA